MNRNEILNAILKKHPKIHCLTNPVTMNDVANILLAAGGSAVMAQDEQEAAEITTDPENYSAVVKAMEEKGYEILSDDLAMVPMTTTRLTDPDQLKAMGKLLDALEDNDDVQNVWHSLENEEDLPE